MNPLGAASSPKWDRDTPAELLKEINARKTGPLYSWWRGATKTTPYNFGCRWDDAPAEQLEEMDACAA